MGHCGFGKGSGVRKILRLSMGVQNQMSSFSHQNGHLG